MKKIMEKQPIREKLSGQNQSYRFLVIRPGGNDTALIKDVVLDQVKRKEINDLMMQFYPNIEQVGFVDLNPVNPQLVMAGGEFCGNATRSTAYLTLNGQPGEIEISVSGVKNKLKAGVDQKNNAYAQMPIYSDPEKIIKDIQNKDSWIVEMEGITQYVTFDTSEIDGLSDKEIKKIANEKIEEKGLKIYPAAGVIYVTQTPTGYCIKPVIWVRDIDTLFCESACGSGTTTLGLVLAKNKGVGIKASVTQPSKMPIDIEVEFDGNKFQYAQIKGPISLLNQGSLEQNTKGNFVIEQINTNRQLEAAFENNLIELYRQIFSQPPYEEDFSKDEVKSFFYEYLDQGILFLARNIKSVVGFGASLPLEKVIKIAEIAKKNNIDVINTWYMADLGVDENYRRLGLGRKLIEARLSRFPKGSTALIRTSENNIVSQKLHLSLGYTIVPGMEQTVRQLRTDGRIIGDRRIFMQKIV